MHGSDHACRCSCLPWLRQLCLPSVLAPLNRKLCRIRTKEEDGGRDQGLLPLARALSASFVSSSASMLAAVLAPRLKADISGLLQVSVKLSTDHL